MKKTLALILALLLALSAFGALAAGKGIRINAKNFPDKHFRSQVSSRDYDLNEDGWITPDEIRKNTGTDMTECDIYDLTGISYFTNMKIICVGGNHLKKLDVSKNTKLRKLVVGKNNLTKLTLGKQKYMNFLICDNNKGLKKLDIGGCPKLLEIFSKGKKTVKSGYVLWRIGKDDNANYLRIPRKCKLLYGNYVLYMGK